ncbi:SWF/SNF family helicase [Geomonas limicola]|uniref:SWF/SNF family helicase n=1 Tax=Geomonas limicola TaxID=2740186 RepID=A0A6V8N969_9BACT|nr:DEAD/DEAH box helicase [Geomonas limicola]GFO69136.1 SWF/SNF family helicase [Geomonas limicola]
MPSPFAPSAALLARLAGLEPAERVLVQLLSVAYAPISKNVLLNLARRFNPRLPGDLKLNAVSLGELLEGLSQAKLVEVSREGVRCNRQIAHQATLSAVRSGSFEGMVLAVQIEVPMVSEWGSSYYRAPQHALRDIRIGFYRQDPNFVFEKLARFERQFPYEALTCHPFVLICSFPFDAQWFATLPRQLFDPALAEILNYALTTFVPVREAFEVLERRVDQGELPQALHDLYCRELMLRGRPDEARSAARAGVSSREVAVLAWEALTRNALDEALTGFEQALALFRKETGKRRTFFSDLSGPLYLVTLIASGDPSLLERADEFCSLVLAKRDWPLQDLYRMLSLVVEERRGARGAGALLETLIPRLSNSPLVGLFAALTLSWSGATVNEVQATLVADLSQPAREAGYLWLADEFELAARACGHAPAEAEALHLRYREAGRIPLIEAIHRTEFWEHALKALGSLNRPEEARGAEPTTSRLIWHFQDHGRYVELQPREQKLSPTGKWSAGKNIALRRLAGEHPELDFLSEQDLQVCRFIKKERESGYYGREVYRLDLDRALPLLTGHPQVYLDAAAAVRLELVAGEPELQLLNEGDHLVMSLSPPFEADQRIYLQKESPTRIKVFQIKEEHRKIATIVGNGLKIPAHAREKTLEAIKSLSGILTVHSDIGSSEAELLVGDPTPCFHLLPYQEGVKLEQLVRPFGEAGPYLKPGTGGETIMAVLEGQRVQARRDLRLELRRGAEALAALPVLAEREEEDGQWLLPAPESALELLVQLQALGESIRVAWPQGARFTVREQVGIRQAKVNIRQAKDWFELEGTLTVNEGLTLDLQELVKLMKDSSGRFVAVGDNEYLALSAELRKRLEELANYAEPHGKGFRFHPLAAGIFEDLTREAGECSTDQHWKDQLKRLRGVQSFEPVLPSTLQAELRGYQEEGFRWLNRLAHWGVGACLADDMGLGKTVQTLAQLLSMASQGPSLVVAPTSVCLNWESEAARFAPTLKVTIFGPGDRARTLQRLKPFDLVICSYGLLQQEAELLAAVSWQGIVLDEAQAIKNLATKRSQAAMGLSGAFKMVATGTPIENHLGELWNVFRFINPGLLGSLKQFNVKYAAPIEKGEEKKARGRLKKLIQPFILRRTKNQVLEELPSRTEITIKVEQSAEEAAFYEALRRSALENLAGVGKVEGKAELHMKILAEIMRLRRACCNPRLVLPESPVPSSKLAAFTEIVEELRENRHKALVFSQFVGHLAIIRENLDRAGIPYQYLDGSTPARQRKERVDAFQAGEGELFLISLKAGGVGLNLTAADYVIHMDPWWNPAVEDQASDRAHRIGQQRPVTIYRLVAKGTIEEKIVGLHQHKRGLADSLLEESDLSGKVSADELLELLRQG